MLDKKSKSILENSRARGWVLEPDAKNIMKQAGIAVPQSLLTASVKEAQAFLEKTDIPVVIKAVSAQIMHKTEYNAVVTHVRQKDHLAQEMDRLLKLPGCKSVLVEQMVDGVELIVGAKNDYQFGPVIVLGTGGTAVEIYNDTAIRMAPLKPNDVFSMVDSLTAKQIILGFRGGAGVNLEILTDLMVQFSHLVMEMEDLFESVDLNPVICSEDHCTVADARIILKPA